MFWLDPNPKKMSSDPQHCLQLTVHNSSVMAIAGDMMHLTEEKKGSF
jgi:hypothetical protein